MAFLRGFPRVLIEYDCKFFKSNGMSIRLQGSVCSQMFNTTESFLPVFAMVLSAEFSLSTKLTAPKLTPASKYVSSKKRP